MKDMHHILFASLVRTHLIVCYAADRSVRVEADTWFGCDEPWGDPVYVTAADDHETEYADAVADLAAATLSDQVRYVAEQLVRG